MCVTLVTSNELAMSSLRSRLHAPLIALSLVLLPTAAFAQGDMSFGVDEVENGGDDGGDDGGDMSFGVDDVEEGGDEDMSFGEDEDEGGGNLLSVVAVPTSDIDAEQRDELQRELMKSMQAVSKYDVSGEGGVLSSLRERNAEQCVRETICIASVGEDAGYNKLVLGRITKVGEEWRLDIDFFDVDERLFIKYKSYEQLGSFKEAIEMVDPAIRDIFDIRQVDDGPEVEDKPRNEWIQPTFAYTTAGLAVACIAGGAVFGSRARNERDAIINAPKNDDNRYEDLTQQDAQDQFDQARRTAQRANLFYGLGVGLGALSAVLFTVDLGSDVASEEELSQRRVRDLKIAPAVSSQGVGAGAFFRF